MTTPYRADIDGLRAVAVAAVVLFHVFPTMLPGGFVGVDVFFVVSGYLITNIIAAEVERNEFSFLRFYARRIRRIFPALLVVLLATLVMGFMVLLPADYERLAMHAIAGAVFIPNLFSWSELGYFNASAQGKPLLHLWSLGIEEQFYLIWPALLLAISTRKHLTYTLAAIIAASLAYSAFASYSDPAAGFYSPLSRIWELGIGGMISVLRLRLPPWAGQIGIVMIIASYLAITEDQPFPGLRAMMPTIGAALVIASKPFQPLAVKPLVWLGLISYPLYLWHWPLLSIAHISDIDTSPVRVVIVVASTFLAWATYRFIEIPVRFNPQQIVAVWGSALGMISIIGLAALVVISDGARLRFREEILPVIDMTSYNPGDRARLNECWLDIKTPATNFGADCSRGSILVWGDSHAARLYPGLTDVFGEVAQFTRDNCPPILSSSTSPCAVSNLAILESIRDLKPQLILLFAAWLNHWTSWETSWKEEDNFRQTIRELYKAGVKEIIVLGPAPHWDPTLPIAVYNYWRAKRIIPDRLHPKFKNYDAADRTLERTAVSGGAKFISIHKLLCNQDGCLTHSPTMKSELLTWDYGHFTTTGAVFVARQLGLGDRFGGR